MRAGNSSIAIGFLGMLSYLIMNYFLFKYFNHHFSISKDLKSAAITACDAQDVLQISIMVLMIIGVLLGMRAWTSSKRKSLIGIILCIVAIILSFNPIWGTEMLLWTTLDFSISC